MCSIHTTSLLSGAIGDFCPSGPHYCTCFSFSVWRFIVLETFMRRMRLSLVLLIFAFGSVRYGLTYAPKTPLVYTKYGAIIGSFGESRNKRQFMSFRGIPYAKPPVGELRFKAPQPIEPWPFAVNGTRDGPFCIQKNYWFSEHPPVEGSEDCLYLNVYVPKVDDNHALLPVMVFIHWGGFFAGRGTSDFLGPEYLMDKDAILVTLNYRLGVFGFFTTLDDAAPGNFGLKDQVAALKFVQENIECFGGDKDRVTIFGQSAGGGSASLHLVSPASKGLFHQAISQSGAMLDLWARPGNLVQTMVYPVVAKFTNCDHHLDNTTNLVACLRSVGANELAETADKFKYFSIEPLTPYSVVVETKTDANHEPFLVKDPLESIKSGEFQKIPWMVGAVHDEGILRVSALTRQPETLKTLNANFSTLIPQMLGLQLSSGGNATELFEHIVEFYLQNKTRVDVNDPRSVQGFVDLYSDRAFLYGIYQSVLLQSVNGHQPIWTYSFEYKGEYTYGDHFAATKSDIPFKWGVSHCDDLLYLFRTPALFPDLISEADLRVSDILLTLWTNFAIHGNPDPHQKVQWKSLDFQEGAKIRNADLTVFTISGSHETSNVSYYNVKGYYGRRMKFWEDQRLFENIPELS